MSSLSLNLAFRYLRSNRGGVFSFTSFLAILGLIIGVSSLIIVMSVMNGFERELQNKILGVVPHAIIKSGDVGPTVRNAKNKVDLSKTIGTNNKKTDAKKTEAKKTTKPAAETKTTTKTKKKFRDTKLGKFLTTKRVKGAKKKTYNTRLNQFVVKK